MDRLTDDEAGMLHARSGRWDEAIDAFRRAVEASPESAVCLEQLAAALEQAQRFGEAADCWGRVARQCPSARAYFRLGYTLHEAGRFSEAAEAQTELIRLDPNNPYAYQSLATTFCRQGRLNEALAHYRRAVELNPSLSPVHSNLIYTMFHDPAASPRALLAEGKRWAQRHEKALFPSHTNDRTPDRRLRIGYFSPDFRTHTIARLIAPVLAAHDRRQAEVFCYSAVARPDAVTQRLRALSNKWREIGTLAPDAAAQLVRSDGIDILVDLAGHMAGNRLLVFAQKPAPIQIQLGFAGTTGLSAMDYRITDAHCDPPGRTEANYCEKLLRLLCAWLYEPDADSPAVGPLPAMSAGHVTFCSPNRALKVTDAAIGVWRRILDGVPGSKLVVLAEEGGADAKHLIDRFASQGIGPDRLVLFPRSSRRKYVELFGRVDIVLDTFPYNGDTTTCDALWMGVPVVTFEGDNFHSRRGVGLLSCVGLTELIGRTPDEYVQIAIGLARDLARLVELRAGLRQRMASSALLDAGGYTRALESAYRQVWREWCGQSAASKTENLQRALALLRSGQPEAAIDHLRQCIARNPDVPEYHNTLGCLLGQTGQHEQAADRFREAIRLRPGYPQAHNNLGAALEQLQYFDEALASYDRAIEQQPGHPEGQVNRSNVLRKLHRIEEAIAAAGEAIRLRGETPEALNSLGAALLENREVQEARRCLERAVKMRPDFAEAHVNLATALLLQGDYEAGWREYAWRCDGQSASHAPQPWRGWVDADLSRKTVLIRSEGGYGNVIQFARYAAGIAARGARVIFECQPALVKLIRSVEGVAEAIAKGAPLPKADGVIPLRCLPQLFGTTLETIPAKAPYLQADAELVGRWRAALDQVPGLRVGVCWQGSRALVHQRDRSFSSMELMPLARVEGVRLVSLQVGARPDARLSVTILPGLEECAGDFIATAALVKSLDLVITCDTAIAHLAGALGVRTWVALRWASDWRFGLDREDCPWYRKMRQFRQKRAGEWGPVFKAMATCLNDQRP